MPYPHYPPRVLAPEPCPGEPADLACDEDYRRFPVPSLSRERHDAALAVRDRFCERGDDPTLRLAA